MNFNNTTVWFPASRAPVWPGIYSVYIPHHPADKFSFWDGARWSACAIQPEEARPNFESHSMSRLGAVWCGWAK